MNVLAGAAMPVVQVDDEPQGGNALPIYLYVAQPTDGREVMGGAALRVKIITDADLAQNGGAYRLVGAGCAVPCIEKDMPYPAQGNTAIAVYIVNP